MRPRSPVAAPFAPPVEIPRRQSSRRPPAQADYPTSVTDEEFEAEERRFQALHDLFDVLERRAGELGIAITDIYPHIEPAELAELNELAPDSAWEEIWYNRLEDDDYFAALAQQAGGSMRGLGALDDSTLARKRAEREVRAMERRLSQAAEKAAAYLQESHAQLMRVAFVRTGAAEALIGRTITPMLLSDYKRTLDRDDNPNDVVLVLDEAVESPQAFAATSNPIRRAGLLSWTTKMNCPSFSLPAGPTGSGTFGSCPGAAGGQSLLAGSARYEHQQAAVYQIHGKAKRHLEQLHGRPLSAESWAELANVNLGDCVCQRCYAEKNKYGYTSNQLQALIRQVWAQAAVEDGSFVEVMDFAVKHTDYKLQGGGDMPAERFAQEHDPEEPAKFFRIHDSGDFFSERYYLAWREVAKRNPDVSFWAPTRIWAQGERATWIADACPPENLIVRPSSYMFSRPAALIDHLGAEGYAAPTTSYPATKDAPLEKYIESGNPYHWNCQAYAGTAGHTCRAAESPSGETGCRACWVYPKLSINYKKH